MLALTRRAAAYLTLVRLNQAHVRLRERPDNDGEHLMCIPESCGFGVSTPPSVFQQRCPEAALLAGSGVTAFCFPAVAEDGVVLDAARLGFGGEKL